MNWPDGAQDRERRYLSEGQARLAQLTEAIKCEPIQPPVAPKGTRGWQAKARLAAKMKRNGGRLLSPRFGTTREQRLINAIARQYDTNPADLLGRSQAQPLPAARAALAHALRNCDYSLPRIAKLLKRHHTSIIYMLQKPPKPPVVVPYSAEDLVVRISE